MVALAARLGLVAEHPLVNAHVAIVAEVRLHDVIQLKARGRPLRQRWRRQRQSRRQRKQQGSDVTHTAAVDEEAGHSMVVAS